MQTKQTISDANDTVNQGVYDATTLHAVDADLAAGNIKSGITIFGILGTLPGGTLSQDITGAALSSLIGNNSSVIFWYYETSLAAGASVTLVTLTQSYDANSMAVAAGVCLGAVAGGGDVDLRLYMGGVLVAQSGGLNGTYDTSIIGTRALSGSQTCHVDLYNNDSGAKTVRLPGGIGGSGSPAGGGMGVGSIKLT